MKQVICLGLLWVMGVSNAWQGCWAVGEDDPLWNKPTYEKKVYKVGQELLKASHIQEKIMFGIEYGKGKDKVNAYAEQGYAQVTVLEGLLKYIESDDELAAVLGHEIGHIILRHETKERMGHIATGTFIAAPLLAVGALGGPVGMVLGASVGSRINKAINMQTSRSLESDADAYGLELMAKAGYNPEAMESLLSKISGDGSKFTIWRSHPVGSKRIAAIHQMIVARLNKQSPPAASPPVTETVQVPKPTEAPASAPYEAVNVLSVKEAQSPVARPLDTDSQHVPDYLKKYSEAVELDPQATQED